MQGKFNSIQNYESIEGTVIEYTFCRNGWFSTPEPDPHLDMSNPQLVADVTDALAQPDQTAGAAPDCPNDPPRWQLPVIVQDDVRARGSCIRRCCLAGRIRCIRLPIS